MTRLLRYSVGACLLLVGMTALPVAQAPQPSASDTAAIELPNRPGSLKFAVLGDFGTGGQPQYDLAERMSKLHQQFPFELVILVGDNIYGSNGPQDFKKKFETPYKPLLDGGVKFYASLGNHDSREERNYKPFNMEGKLYYSFKAPKQDVRFIALETSYPTPEQMKWVEETLKSSKEKWKFVFFHHPLYSSGKTHGSDDQLRATLEPLLVQNGVTVVFAGHDHMYERTKPQQGITHFVAGSGGQLRPGNGRHGLPFSAKIVDDTNVFMAVEILDDQTMVFNAVSRTGAIVDSGTIVRRTE